MRFMRALLPMLTLALLFTGCTAPESDAPSAPAGSPVMSEAPEAPELSDSPDTPSAPPPEYSPAPPTAEYKKITPQEAEEMMSGDVVILDVRTQEEYYEGHIRKAVLLPDYEVAEKAEKVFEDKEQTILVYCRTGRRSELAARALIELGYTNVYDFGGIVDWPGEIFVSYSLVHYNYFGGELPEDIVTPIEYMETQYINGDMPAFEFWIEGETIGMYGFTSQRDRYYLKTIMSNISKLTILSKDGSFRQEIIYAATIFYGDIEHVLKFDDWNFDGYFDIRLQKDHCNYYWLWDKDVGGFVANKELEEMDEYSSLSIYSAKKRIVSNQHLPDNGLLERQYEYNGDNLVLVKSEIAELDSEKGWRVYHVIVEELIDGKMIITEDYYEDYGVC